MQKHGGHDRKHTREHIRSAQAVARWYIENGGERQSKYAQRGTAERAEQRRHDA